MSRTNTISPADFADEQVLVRHTPAGLQFRRAGSREATAVTVPYGSCYMLACKAAAEAERTRPKRTRPVPRGQL